jgi:hypothetical protein
MTLPCKISQRQGRAQRTIRRGPSAARKNHTSSGGSRSSGSHVATAISRPFVPWARQLGISHTWLQRLAREFQENPGEIQRELGLGDTVISLHLTTRADRIGRPVLINLPSFIAGSLNIIYDLYCIKASSPLDLLRRRGKWLELRPAENAFSA